MCAFRQPPTWANHLIRKLDIIEGIIMSNQDTLNQLVADINAAVAVLAQEISDLETAVKSGTPEQIDFTGANAALAALQALEPAPAPAPASDPTA